MDPQVKKLLDDLNSTFAQFREANDERLKKVEAKTSADPLLENKVNALNTAIDKINDRIKEVETAAARIPAGGTDAKARKEELEQARLFLMLTKGTPMDEGAATDIDLETVRAYHKPFMNYLRRGTVNDAMSVGSSPDGGFWVLPDTTGKIVSLVYETSPMRQICDVQAIGSDALEGMYDNDEVTSGGWVGETSDRSADTATPQIGKWRIEANEQWVQPKATQKFLDDAFVDVEAWLTRKISDKLARVENAAFVNGTGVSQPRGILSYPIGLPTKNAFQKVEELKTGVNNAFAAAGPGDIFIDALGKLKGTYRQDAVWIGTRTTRAAIRKLKDGQGNYLWLRDFSQSSGTMQGDAPLLGHPFQEMADMPEITAAAAGAWAIGVGNFKMAYQIVDRFGIRVLRDPLTLKGYIKFYTTKRVGGAVVNFEAYKLIRFSA
jgi:HK97 family phage major capsid protein